VTPSHWSSLISLSLGGSNWLLASVGQGRYGKLLLIHFYHFYKHFHLMHRTSYSSLEYQNENLSVETQY